PRRRPDRVLGPAGPAAEGEQGPTSGAVQGRATRLSAGRDDHQEQAWVRAAVRDLAQRASAAEGDGRGCAGEPCPTRHREARLSGFPSPRTRDNTRELLRRDALGLGGTGVVAPE